MCVWKREVESNVLQPNRQPIYTSSTAHQQGVCVCVCACVHAYVRVCAV